MESQLRSAGMDAYRCDVAGCTRDDVAQVKDLIDLTRLCSDDFEAIRELLSLTQF